MRSWTKPTPDQIQAALALLARPRQLAYFFDHLDNPEWVEPLARAGLFDYPPDLQKAEEGQGWTAPPWAQSRYLARMAGHVPDKVRAVIEKCSPTRNPIVRSDFLDAAGVMPPSMATTIARLAEDWCSEPYFLLPEKVRVLIAHLAKGNQVNAALQLAGAVLATRSQRSAGSDSSPLFGTDAIALIDVWQYEAMLATFLTEVVPTARRSAIALLVDLLVGALANASRTDQIEADYLSYSWRSAIEDHPQNSEAGGIKSLLVSAIRDASDRLIQDESESIEDILRVLHRHDRVILRRIELYLLTRHLDRATDVAISAIDNKENFASVPLRHEYYHLSVVAFANAPLESQRHILAWIDEGADREQIAASIRDRTGAAPPAEEVERVVRMRQRDRLMPIAGALPDEWRLRYQQLLAEFGPHPHPDFLIWHGPIRQGETSPVGAEQLGAMSADDCIDFVLGWRPEATPDAPSPYGLAQEFRRQVAGRPNEFIASGARLLTVHPTYLRAFFEGLTDAVKSDTPYDQSGALMIAAAAISMQDGPRRERGWHDWDSGYGLTRTAVLDWITHALRLIRFEAANSDAVVEILARLAEDPDPAATQPADPSVRAVDVAINSVRGRTTETLVLYVEWLVAAGLQPAGRAITGHPVSEVLSRRLNLAIEPTLAVRSVFGLTLAAMARLDQQWLEANLAAYFPSDQPEASQVVWNAYVAFTHPSGHLYELLKSQYAIAAELLPSRLQVPGRVGVDERLGEHLAHLYLDGVIEIGRGDILEVFYTRADLATRLHVLEYLGRLLSQTSEGPKVVLERSQNLWSHRQSVAIDTGELAELRPFAWWFGSRALDAKWRLDRLSELLGRDVVPEPGFVIVQELANVAPAWPEATIAALEGFLDRDRPGVIAGAFEVEIAAVFDAVLATGRDQLVPRVRALANRLGEIGYFNLRRFA